MSTWIEAYLKHLIFNNRPISRAEEKLPKWALKDSKILSRTEAVRIHLWEVKYNLILLIELVSQDRCQAPKLWTKQRRILEICSLRRAIKIHNQNTKNLTELTNSTETHTYPHKISKPSLLKSMPQTWPDLFHSTSWLVDMDRQLHQIRIILHWKRCRHQWLRALMWDWD